MNWMCVHLVPMILVAHLTVSVCHQARVTPPCSSSSSRALPPRPWAPGRASLIQYPHPLRHRAQHCTRPPAPTSTYRAAKVSPKSARPVSHNSTRHLIGHERENRVFLFLFLESDPCTVCTSVHIYQNYCWVPSVRALYSQNKDFSGLSGT